MKNKKRILTGLLAAALVVPLFAGKMCIRDRYRDGGTHSGIFQRESLCGSVIVCIAQK